MDGARGRSFPGAPRPRGRAALARLRADGWGFALSLGVGLAALGLYLGTPAVHVPRADGFYSWIYARSLAFDGDVEFTNDYRLCGDVYRIGLDRGTGHPDNIFYPGPALFWVPLVLAARAVLPVFPAATCGPPWTSLAFGVAPLLLALTPYLAYRLARRRFDDGVAALATALVVLGGPLFRVATVLPSYSHVHDALCVAALLVAAARAVERPERPRRWGWVALALAAAVLQRLSNAAFALVPAVMAVAAARASPRRLWPAALGVGAGLALGLGTMGALYRYLYGSPFVFSHGRYFLDPWHPHPWLLLFDREEGLFFHAPLLWLAVFGLGSGARDRGRWPLLAPLLLVAFAEGWLSAAALDWPPARRFANLTPLLAWLAAYPLDGARRWLARGSRALVAAAALAGLPVAVYAVGYGWGQPRGLVPSERPLTQAELYGGAAQGFWALVDQTVGGVATWPAERVFQARYGLPGDRLGDAAFPRWYLRDFRTLEFGPRGLPLSNATVRRLTRGLAPVSGGARPTSARAAVVFAAEWRVAPHLTVHATVTAPVTLRVGFRSFLGRTVWCGEAQPLAPGGAPLVFGVPAGAFGSGLNELLLEFSPAAIGALTLHAITFEDRRALPPAFE